MKDYGKYIIRSDYLTKKMDEEVIDSLMNEITLESKLDSQPLPHNIPKNLHKFYCPISGRHKITGIPYSSPP